MQTDKTIENPLLQQVVKGLREALGERLHGVVLYGSAARGDYHEATSDLNVLIVLERLDPASLEALTPELARWKKKGQPGPRLLSPEIIADSADVFPIEFLDLQSGRVLLYGKDPFPGVKISKDHLRLQCERELREKMMRLREAYVDVNARPKDLKRLLTSSYSTFTALFRGCLHLLGGEVPVRNPDVVRAFCARGGLDPAPFEQVDRLKRGEDAGVDARSLFLGYYAELTKAVNSVDRFDSSQGGNAS